MSDLSIPESVSDAVVNYIHQAQYQDFPEEAVRLAKRCIIDGLGVMLAGSTNQLGKFCMII
jgi:2-methylcitrate dehydratase PrpD